DLRRALARQVRGRSSTPNPTAAPHPNPLPVKNGERERTSDVAMINLNSSYFSSYASLRPLLPQHMIAELAGIGEVRHAPAVEVVFGHASLGKALEPVGIPGGLRTEQAIAADLLGRAAIIDLVELVAAAELAAEAVPQQLEQLDPLLGLVAVGAAQIAI